MSSMDWFRWHHGSVNDPKFQLVARKSGASVAEVIAVWATLLESASMSEPRGSLGQLDFEAIDCFLGLTEGLSHTIKRVMSERGLLDTDSSTVSSWKKRQPAREREDLTSTDRVRAYRERQANSTDNADGESMKHHVTPCNAEKRLDESRLDESRLDKVVNCESVGTNSRKKPATSRRTTLDPAFYPNETGVRIAEGKGLNVAIELQKFSDYHLANGNLMADWQAAFRKWIGNAYPAKTATQPRQQPESFRERDARIAAYRMAEFAPGIARKPAQSHNTINLEEQSNVIVIAGH